MLCLQVFEVERVAELPGGAVDLGLADWGTRRSNASTLAGSGSGPKWCGRSRLIIDGSRGRVLR